VRVKGEVAIIGSREATHFRGNLMRNQNVPSNSSRLSDICELAFSSGG